MSGWKKRIEPQRAGEERGGRRRKKLNEFGADVKEKNYRLENLRFEIKEAKVASPTATGARLIRALMRISSTGAFRF